MLCFRLQKKIERFTDIAQHQRVTGKATKTIEKRKEGLCLLEL